jgi:hypothetical protein
MKKVLFVLVVALISQSMVAQAGKAVTVPSAVASAFSARFPSGQLKKWEQRKEGYVAVFRQDGKKYFAYYKADGTWSGTEMPIKWTKNLPPVVRKGWLKSEYASWYVRDIKKIETPDGPLYALHMDNSPNLDSDHNYAFGEEWVVFFSGKGEIVRKDQMP